jgi:hypothetical protein
MCDVAYFIQVARNSKTKINISISLLLEYRCSSRNEEKLDEMNAVVHTKPSTTLRRTCR